MDVVFFERDFTGKISLAVDVAIERYSWNMIGGPQKAYLSTEITADRWELMKLIRCPVEIYDDAGGIVWWGYVNRVTVPQEEQRFGLGLDELYNYVIAAYADGDTAAASDATSITEYGQKEYRLNDNQATQTEGEASRDLYLGEHKYARPELEFSGGDDSIKIECYGWYTTLGWKYYALATYANTENTTQISAIVTAAGQHLAGTIVEDTAGITSNEYRDGRSPALGSINALLNAGTSNTRPLLAYVDKTRYLHVYERDVEPTTNPDYLLREDGRLITPLGRVVPDQECKVGVWVKVKDVPDTLGGISAMRPFFVESAEYNTDRDKTTYRAAGAFEQTRLAKYIATVVSGRNGMNGAGGVYSPPIWWTPEAAPLTWDIKTVYYTSTDDIPTDTAVYLHPTSTLSAFVNKGSTGLTSGAVGGSKNGWISAGRQSFIVIVNADIFNGASAPTEGFVTVGIYRTRVSTSSNTEVAFQTVPFGTAIGAYSGNLGWEFSLVTVSEISVSNAEAWTFKVTNLTDGDIEVFSLKAIMIKI